jgi:hypothetical protein
MCWCAAPSQNRVSVLTCETTTNFVQHWWGACIERVPVGSIDTLRFHSTEYPMEAAEVVEALIALFSSPPSTNADVYPNATTTGSQQVA